MKPEPNALFEGEGNSRTVPEIPEYFRKFPNASENSRVLPEIPQNFRKFPSTSGNSRIISGNSRVVPNILGAFRACVACIVMMHKVTVVIRVFFRSLII